MNRNNLRKPNEIILKNGKTLEEVLELHEKWLNDEEDGERADLSGEDLSYTDLYEADLGGANLNNADLSYTNLSLANLRCANLKYSNLSEANLYKADLTNAKFYSTNLYKAKGDFVNVGNIGSRNDTTHYFYKDDMVICGCFSGTMKEFEEKVKERYNEDNKEYQEYTMAVEFLKRLSKLEINN